MFLGLLRQVGGVILTLSDINAFWKDPQLQRPPPECQDLFGWCGTSQESSRKSDYLMKAMGTASWSSEAWGCPGVQGICCCLHAYSQDGCPKVTAVCLVMCSSCHASCAGVCLPHPVLDILTRLLCFPPPSRPSAPAVPFPALPLSQASEGRAVAVS